ncbi:putative Cytosine/purine/uracil/thiamine/allantoin permease family protein [Streptomyces misionensis JCM 4497]
MGPAHDRHRSRRHTTDGPSHPSRRPGGDRPRRSAAQRPLRQRGPAAGPGRRAHVDDVQLHGAVGRHGPQHGLLDAGLRSDRRRHGLEAGGVHHRRRQSGRAGPDAADRARGTQVRHPLPRLRPRLLRGARRQPARRRAGVGGLRLVRHPDVDRRGGHLLPRRETDRRQLVERGAHRRLRLDHVAVVRGLLGAASGHHPPGDGDHPPFRELGRAVRAGRRVRDAVVDGEQGGRCRPAVRPALQAELGRVVLEAVLAVSDGHDRVLVHPVPEHPGLHPLRPQPACPDLGPGARPAHHHDPLRLPLGPGHLRLPGGLRKAGVGPGAAGREDRQPGRPALRPGHRPGGDPLGEHRGQPGLAGLRLLQRGAAQGEFPRRGADHRGPRGADLPLEAVLRPAGLHLHLARPGRRAARHRRRHPRRRLLVPAPHPAGPRRPVPHRRPLLVRGRLELAGGRRLPGRRRPRDRRRPPRAAVRRPSDPRPLPARRLRLGGRPGHLAGAVPGTVPDDRRQAAHHGLTPPVDVLVRAG